MSTSFHAQIGALLASQPLMWPGKTDYPIKVAKLWFWQVWGWEKMSWQITDQMLQSANSFSFYSMKPLIALFWQPQAGYPVAFRRSTGQAGEYDLVIAIRIGLRRVGIQTKFIE